MKKVTILILLVLFTTNTYATSAVHYFTGQKIDNSNSIYILKIVDYKKFKKYKSKDSGHIYYEVTAKLENTLRGDKAPQDITFKLTTSIFREAEGQLVSTLYATIYPINNLHKNKKYLCFFKKNKDQSYSLAVGSRSSLEPLGYNTYIFSYFDLNGKIQRILCNDLNEYINLIKSHINYKKKNTQKYKFFSPEANWSNQILKPNAITPKRVQIDNNQNSTSHDNGNEELDIFNDTK